MFDKILDQPLNGWQQQAPWDSPHIVLSSRIRLARNFKDILFTSRGTKESLQEVAQRMRRVLTELHTTCQQEFSNMRLEQLSDRDREILVEKHLISPNLAQALPDRGLIVSEDGSIAIMVNEEDHIRIQAMALGLNLDAAYEMANRVDDVIEGKYDYAFSEQFGYLTACPTNVGTGLRASVMIHLPALAMTGRLQRLVRSIIQLGYTVRGLYGEGSEALGNVYQVSNQLTMGVSEEDTIAQLKKVVQGLVEEELKARTLLIETDKGALEDRVWRAYGVLLHARRLTGEEALALNSDIQLGMDMGLLPVIKKPIFDELLVITRPNFLCKYANKESMSAVERDEYRANVVRDMLK